MSTVPLRAWGYDRRILRAAAAVTLASLAVKLVATAKEFVVAGVFARSDAMEAYLAAALVPGLLINLIAESMNQALIPTLIRVREQQGQRAAQRLLESALLWSCGLLAAVSLAMAGGARVLFPLLAWGFAPGKLDLAVRLFYGMLPVVVLTGISANCAAVLNTVDRFAWPVLVSLATPVLVLGAALTLGARMGVWSLVAASVAGAAVQAGVTAVMLRRSGYRFTLRWHGMDEPAREVARQYGPVLGSSVVASGGLLADQAMAALLPAGSVAALAYANRFVSVAVTLLAGAVATAVTPSFAEMTARADWAACRRTLRRWGWGTAAASLPVTVALIAGSGTLVRLAYQHGRFSAADGAAVTPVLAMYALQIPFFVASRVHYRFVLAMRRTDVIFWCGLINLLLDVGLNLILMRRMGVAGIALATSLWTISTLVFLWWWGQRLLRLHTGGMA